MLKPYKQRQTNVRYTEKIHKFVADCEMLFDIAACKCVNLSACSCEKDKKVPINEREFLIDQRTNRRMFIGNVDISATKQLQKQMKRKIERQLSQRSKRGKYCSVNDNAIDHDNFTEDDEEPETDNDNAIDANTRPSSHTLQSDDSAVGTPTTNYAKTNCADTQPEATIVAGTQMRILLPTAARECDRWGISDRSAAAIASAVLQDIGIIDETDSSAVIDRSKIRRERQKHRKDLGSVVDRNKDLQGLYFDGRKNKTRKQIAKGKKYHPTTEEHIVLVSEPGAQYMGHVTPSSGKSADLKDSIVTFLTQNDIKTEKLVAIGCDGTNVNTGCDGGVIRLLELHCNRPFHWFVCQLHMNELPLHHLLIHIDGVTLGPNSFTGPIGKSLSIVVCQWSTLNRLKEMS